MPAELLDEVIPHVRAEYEGVFTDGMLSRYVGDYVEMGAASELLERVRGRRPPPARLLDVGCGYGSFVLGARDAGFDAVGIEPASFERRIARERLAAERPDDDPTAVYLDGDALALPFEDASFDVVTLWNLLEHVVDYGRTLAEAVRVLRARGLLLAVAPNYAAFRREAHYHVPWLPLMPRRIAIRYLRLLGRDPTFFNSQVHYCTNLGVRRELKRLGAPATAE
jgi:MPBQ/MSBQ methyltransferase